MGRPTARKPCRSYLRRKPDPLGVHLKGILARHIRLAVSPRNGESPCTFSYEAQPNKRCERFRVALVEAMPVVRSQIPAGEARPFEVKAGAIIDESAKRPVKEQWVPGRQMRPYNEFVIRLWDRLLTNTLIVSRP